MASYGVAWRSMALWGISCAWCCVVLAVHAALHPWCRLGAQARYAARLRAAPFGARALVQVLRGLVQRLRLDLRQFVALIIEHLLAIVELVERNLGALGTFILILML